MYRTNWLRWLPNRGIPFRFLIAFCLFLTLTTIAAVTLWFYYSNATFMAKQSANTYLQQQQELSKLSFDGWMTSTETFVALARQDPSLIHQLQSLRKAGNPDRFSAIEERLTALTEQYQANQVDLLIFISSDHQTHIMGGSTPYRTELLLTQLKQYLPNTGFQLTLPFPPQNNHPATQPHSSDPQDTIHQSPSESLATTKSLTASAHPNSQHHNASGLVFVEEVIAGKFGKRLGYLAGVVVLNDNFQMLNQIISRTGATASALLIEGTDNRELLTWMNTDNDQPLSYNEIMRTHQALGHYTEARLGQGAFMPTLTVQLWNETSYLDAHQIQFKQTLVIVVFLILLLGLSIGLFATRLSGRALKYLSTFAQQKTSTDAYATFKATPIREINDVGNRLEQAIFALARNEEMYRNILNYSGAIVYIKDLNGHFHFVNSEFESVTGLTMTDVQGKTNEDLFPLDIAQTYTTNDQKVAREERVLNFREDLTVKGDTISFVSVKFPIRDHDQQLKYICGFSTDITGIIQTQQELSREKERAQEATNKLNTLNQHLEDAIEEKTHELESAQESLIQSEKLASLGALVAGISHELNTPIGTALTVTTTLQERTDTLNEDVASGKLSKRAMNAYMNDLKESGDILYRSLTSAIELISSFKQLSVDQTSQQRRVFSLKQTIEEVATTHKHLLKSSRIKLVDLVEEDVQMDSFPGALIQVLNNLLQNAMRHAFDDDQTGSITLTAVTQDKQVQITLSDDGQGIPHDQLHKVFDPFFTTKMGQGGTGLGLHIVHSIITGMLGGKVTINSRYGGVNSGTDFLITLPTHAPIKPLAEDSLKQPTIESDTVYTSTKQTHEKQ